MAEYDSVTVTTTETTLYESNLTGDRLVYVDIDVSTFQSGDTFVLRLYEKVDGTNYRLVDDETFSGAQTYSGVRVLDAKWANAAMDVKVTMQKTAGTDRAVGVRKRAKV